MKALKPLILEKVISNDVLELQPIVSNFYKMAINNV